MLTLRSVADADAIKAAVSGGGRLVVIGAGWIGCEVAASARGLGAEVTVVEQAGSPLEAVLGPKLGAFFADLHREHGVELRMGAAVERIGDGGVVVGGETVAADAVLLATGVAPATALAEAAGLEVGDGILVDELLRTSADAVYAAGDVANTLHPRYGRIRVEHWDNAIAQGEAAARSMLGKGEPYAKLPYFFTDQYDLGWSTSAATRPRTSSRSAARSRSATSAPTGALPTATSRPPCTSTTGTRSTRCASSSRREGRSRAAPRRCGARSCRR